MLDDILHPLSWKTILLAISIIYAVRLYVAKLQASRHINALGGRAPLIPTWLPGSVDFIIAASRSYQNHTDLQFWQSFFTASKTTTNPHPHTAEISLFGNRVIFTEDPANLKAVYSTQFKDYGKGPGFLEDWKEFLGASILTTDGEQWHSSRTMLRPYFNKDRISDLAIFERHTQVLLRALAADEDELRSKEDACYGTRVRVNITNMMHRFTMDVSSEFLFGKSTGSLENGDEAFSKAFDEVKRVQLVRTRAGPLKSLVNMKSWRAGLKVIDATVAPYIEAAINVSTAELKDAERHEKVFIDDLASMSQDRKFVRDQIVTMLMAGRDTTASMLIWTIYHLSRDERVLSRLRKEILHTIGTSDAPTYEDLKLMKYLQYTMQETLRMYPPPFSERLSMTDTTLPYGGGLDGLSPVGVPKGTVIGFSSITMHRRQDLMPDPTDAFPDVNTWCPDRWDNWRQDLFAYAPFMVGPRICIGQQFALTEWSYTLVRILQRFDRLETFVKGGGEPGLVTGIVNLPIDDLMAAFWRADCLEDGGVKA